MRLCALKAGGGSQGETGFDKRWFLQVRRAERQRWGAKRLSPQLPGMEGMCDQRKRQETEYPP